MSEFETTRLNPFSCEDCGGRMVFDPASQELRCPYCGRLRAFQAERETPYAFDIRYAPPLRDAAWGDTVTVARCDGCGTDFLLTGETDVRACPFCGGVPAPTEEPSGIAPDSVIPFRLTQSDAQKAMRKWLRGKPFVTSAVKKRATLEGLTAVYLPYWTYLDEATSVYEGRAGRKYDTDIPVSVTDRDGKQRTETRREARLRWEPAAGIVSGAFDDVMIPGGEQLPESLLKGVQPYQMSQRSPYTAEFVAGFACVRPTVDAQGGWQQGQKLVDQRMAVLAERHILGEADEAEVQRLRTTHQHVRYKLTLLPAYLTLFRHRKKACHVLINGQNGRVAGPRPISALRVTAAVLLALGLLAGAVWLFLTVGGGAEYMFYDASGRLATLL